MPATGNTANAEETDNAAAAPAPAPEPAADPTKPEHINLKFHDQHGNECHFKLKKTMRLKKAMDAFSARTSRERRTLRFFFEGLRVLDDHTPEQVSTGTFWFDGSSEEWTLTICDSWRWRRAMLLRLISSRLVVAIGTLEDGKVWNVRTGDRGYEITSTRV